MSTLFGSDLDGDAALTHQAARAHALVPARSIRRALEARRAVGVLRVVPLRAHVTVGSAHAPVVLIGTLEEPLVARARPPVARLERGGGRGGPALLTFVSLEVAADLAAGTGG